MASAPRRGGVNISFATTRSHQLARGALTSFVTLARAREVFLNSQGRRDAARPDRAAWAVQRLLAAAATLSATGSASPRPDRTSWLGGALTSFVTLARAREVFLNSQGRRDAARPDRAAWAVQRLLAAAATLSATGSASPRPDRTSWLGGLRRAFSPAFRAGSLYPLARGRRRIWRGEKWLRRRDGGALTSASPRPDRTSWLGGR